MLDYEKVVEVEFVPLVGNMECSLDAVLWVWVQVEVVTRLPRPTGR